MMTLYEVEQAARRHQQDVQRYITRRQRIALAQQNEKPHRQPSRIPIVRVLVALMLRR